ncbi:MAG: endonuclease Q family protein [Nanoarchaeota archaeon]|nr:endonuclease Q family protein [Nanoarchaeota archaeon]MBU1270342.1 endonuclease Q family protein [Nanoarchaeota archaeon]MBU1604657.1 endonuclease Q family protein [Nanoarchaeota archaeon]MBU2443134.1 endonuclease Q family protein [Nanoarchaeota archaeon]
MRYISDLHIHSKYSRACSTELTIPNLEKWAKIKGVDVLGTGDFTHPKWIEELKSNLKDDGSGIMRTQNGFPFVLQTEISLIYSQANKGRRVHHIVLAPSFEVVDQITEYLKKHGRVDYDGRPIFKISSDNLLYELRRISQDVEVIPAHIWTPWFSLFGSNSGFDSVHECFKDQEKYVHALETGLSSDPAMNWQLSQLDKFNLVSFSDAHSFWPWRIGREATIFELKELSYANIIRVIRSGEGLLGTVEVDPSYGKYHFDGHRNCNIVMSPEQSVSVNNVCPKCNSNMTLGVAHRIRELADRPQNYKPENAKTFYTMLPLSEILAKIFNKTISSKIVWREYNKVLRRFGSEYEILLNASKSQLREVTYEQVAEAIIKNRSGLLKVIPGYDGVYGELVMEPITNKELEEDEKEKLDESKQQGLSDFF